MRVEEKLLELRQTLNLNQGQMAKGVVSISSLSRIEHGYNTITANDLFEILQRNDVSLVDFLKEFSSARVTFKEYQRQLEGCFENQDLKTLRKFVMQGYFPRGIMSYLASDMVRFFEGRKVKYPLKIRFLLKKMDAGDELFLWSLAQCLKVYSHSLFAELVERVLEVNQDSGMVRTSEELVEEIFSLVLAKKEDGILWQEVKEVSGEYY